MIKTKAVHLADALRLLADGKAHDLTLWKLSTGDIISYEQARIHGAWRRAGLHRVVLPNGGFRTFRDVTLISIDRLKVYI